MEKIFGIDLGTTNSEIAYWHDGKVTVIPIEHGRLYLPSVVGLDASENIITGNEARNQRVLFPDKTICSIKRKMGSGEILKLGNKEFTPAEISAEILKRLKKAAEKETGIRVQKAVITVPAYFNDAERRDTIRAGELAGLEVLRIINEPTAAALAYGAQQVKREKMLVYDFGGGTFDVSLVSIDKGIIEVLATDGNHRLGGDDLDSALRERLFSSLPEDTDKNNNRLNVLLTDLAERIKIELSTKVEVAVNEGFVASSGGSPLNLETTVSRSSFEADIEDMLHESFQLMEKVIKAAKIEPRDITRVVLVGGTTYIPRIFRTLRDEYQLDVHREIDPAYCVAMGAAIQGAIIAGENTETILVDVAPHSMGVQCLTYGLMGIPNFDHFSILISKNTALPASMNEIYHTCVENQEAVEIKVFQGESPLASKNTQVGSFIFDGLPKNLPENSEFEIRFSYNLNGTIEVTAIEKTTGGKKEASFDINHIQPTSDNTTVLTDRTRIDLEKKKKREYEQLIKLSKKKAGKTESILKKTKILKTALALEQAINERDPDCHRLAAELKEITDE